MSYQTVVSLPGDIQNRHCCCIRKSCFFINKQKTIVIYINNIILFALIYYNLSNPFLFQLFYIFPICTHFLSRKGINPYARRGLKANRTSAEAPFRRGFLRSCLFSLSPCGYLCPSAPLICLFIISHGSVFVKEFSLHFPTKVKVDKLRICVII